MPTAATTAASPRQGARSGNAQAVVAMVPFIRASSEHREPAGIDVSRLLTGADQDLGVFDIPAYGYLRSVLLVVTSSGGSGGSATTAEDGPWSALKSIAITEPNGATIVQFNSGYDLKMACKWGGYRTPEGADPQASPTFSAVNATTGQFAFVLRLPIELNLRDSLGALPNQNAAATFKLRVTLAASTAIYATPPATTLPTVRVRAFIEAWDQPENQSAGQTNQVTPPAMNTTQFWSTQVYNINSGAQTVRLTRVGNYLRNLIFIFRTSTRAAADPLFPDPLTVYLDTRPLDIIERNNFKYQMYERSGFGAVLIANDAARGLDNGVYVYDFMHEFDGAIGRENRDLWLPTLGSTRLELQGSFGGAGTLTVLTNDVAIAGSVFI